MGSLLLIGATAAVAVLILWFGRKERATAFPLAFVFVLFAAITIPSILPPRIVQAQNACLANLKFIQGAKATWAERYHKLPGDVPRLEEIFSTNNVPPY